MKSPKYESQRLYWKSPRERRKPDHPVIKAFAEPKIRYMNKIIRKHQEGKPLSILDVGCGNGFFTHYFEGFYTTYALDFSRAMLKNNSSKKKICGSATQLPFGDDSFDIAFCSNLLHHLEEPEVAILEMKRVSREYVVLSEPNRNNPLMFMFGLIKKEEQGTLRFSLRYMQRLIKRAGLRLISASNIGIILPNKTPSLLLSLLRQFDGEFAFAFYNIIVSEKLR
ncbi:hypothetical protein LCGC14_0699820 [marine sediment metagenome]|uniref:Methyltransferase type 11 domain-containing protein n=1 Tax=marine sediment metagenome TaxID=412755 RepID=A0A0F9R3I5_9ZZZZ|nr:class I SAM-dependent methyltransferase [Candidatus Aminicenantes bacterium]